MKKFEIELALDEVGEAKRAWAKAQTKFNSDISAVMTRLLHEAAHNYMSAEDVARHTGFTVKRVRQLMRDAGLNPRDGKNMLSKIAADALTNNAALMGIEPHEMDLTSPLAYLPMGEEMKRELRAKVVSQVHEVSENPVADALFEMAEEIKGYCTLVSNHNGQCTCFTATKQIENKASAIKDGRA